MGKAVCDTSTLIRLYKGEVLYCLTAIFERIYLPWAVRDECKDEILILTIEKPPFEVCRVKHVLNLGMGLGEREALSLAVELGIRTILIDDDRGFKKAERLKLRPLQTRDLLLLAKYSGIIPSVKTVLETMKVKREYLADDVYREMLEDAGEG